MGLKAARVSGVKRLCAMCLCAFLSFALAAQRIKSMEFRNQSIVDILLALGEASGTSIVPDETVSGNASFFFADSDLMDSLSLFLAAYRLYSTRSGNVIHVSRIAASYDRERRLVAMRADDVDIQLLVRALSKAVGATILYDSLPRANLSLSIDALDPEKVLEILMKRFPEYRVQAEDSYYYLRKVGADAKEPIKGTPKPAILKSGDTYSLDLDKGHFLETLARLFAAAGKEYSLLTRSDSVLENLYFSGRSFDELLRLVLEQGNADFVQSGGVYYVFEIQRKDVLKKLMRTLVIPLKYVSVQDIANLLPADLSSGSQLRVDRGTNSVLVTGSEEGIAPLRDFLLGIDRPLEGRSYHRFDLRYAKAKDLVALLPAKLAATPPILLPEGNAFLLLAPDEAVEPVNDFLRLVDKKTEGFPVRLKFIKSEELLKNPPPAVAKEELVDSGDPGLVFFVGSEDKRRVFLREVALVDRPRPQIRYQLLVVQYDQSTNLNWTKNIAVSGAQSDSSNSVALSLSNLLNLSFDVVSRFGALFAAQLNLELDENRAHVFADTTLTGLSGQDVKFQNTNTFRYREIEINATTGQAQYTGVTSSITSGLIVGINGWVSGEGMITMSVNATVSKQGESASMDGGSLPSTSEKVVATQLRTPSGAAIVIGGLLEKSVSSAKKKVPFFGDIPLLGWLFTDTVKTEQNNEIVLYIVPRLTYGEESDEALLRERLDSLYDSCVRGFEK
jgi:type II secretory pathway component GspD/PulD (secretin)